MWQRQMLRDGKAAGMDAATGMTLGWIFEEHADGSRFRVRCADLGTGPVADDFGTVRTTALVARFETREEDIAIESNVPLPSTLRRR